MSLVVGPVFPHEVVGFSGGNKYFFPGVAGQEVIDFSHWLGALITSAEIIGTRGITPVRALINEAAAMIPSRRLALCLVAPVRDRRVACRLLRAPRGGMGRVRRGLRRNPRALPGRTGPAGAVDHPDQVRGHLDRRERVLQGGTGRRRRWPGDPVRPAHHPDLGDAPPIQEIGYHCRDYFLGQWDRFKDYHWGDLAHSTHLRGAGTWDPENGEHGRVTVTLATGIPEDIVRAANLDYLDPALVDIQRDDRRPRHARRSRRPVRCCTGCGERSPRPLDPGRTPKTICGNWLHCLNPTAANGGCLTCYR